MNVPGGRAVAYGSPARWLRRLAFVVGLLLATDVIVVTAERAADNGDPFDLFAAD